MASHPLSLTPDFFSSPVTFYSPLVLPLSFSPLYPIMMMMMILVGWLKTLDQYYLGANNSIQVDR